MAETGRPLTDVVITPEMIAAGAAELVFDSSLVRRDVARDIIVAALTEGGYEVSES